MEKEKPDKNKIDYKISTVQPIDIKPSYIPCACACRVCENFMRKIQQGN
jgi:hypothetical protein